MKSQEQTRGMKKSYSIALSYSKFKILMKISFVWIHTYMYINITISTILICSKLHELLICMSNELFQYLGCMLYRSTCHI